jgi:diadenosine tetraphosphate (Ap4A) HIT family hydrolase
MPDCVFCGIVSGAIPAPLLHEDDLCVAVADLSPKAPLHLLILPREHLASTAEVGPERERLVGRLVRVAVRLAGERGLAESGYRLVFNTGPDAGQTVAHLHLHLLGGGPLADLG